MNKYKTDYLNNLSNLGLYTDRIVDETPSLPYDLNELKVKPNDEVTATVFNNVIEKLNHNYLSLLDNSRVSNPLTPTSKSCRMILNGNSFIIQNYNTSAESDLLKSDQIIDIVSARTKDNMATVSFMATKTSITALNYIDRNEQLDTANIMLPEPVDINDLKFLVTGILYSGQKDFNREVTINNEKTTLFSTFNGMWYRHPNPNVKDTWVAAGVEGPNNDYPMHYVQNVKGERYLNGEPVYWAVRFDNYGFQLINGTDNAADEPPSSRTKSPGVDYQFDIYYSSENVLSPDKVQTWKACVPEGNDRYFDPANFTISLVSTTPDENNNLGAIETSPYIKTDNTSNASFKNIKALEFDDELALFVLDDNVIHKYETESLTSNTIPSVEKSMRNHVLSVGGSAGTNISSKNKFSNAKGFSIYNGKIYVIDQPYDSENPGNTSTFIKIFDNNLNFIDIFNISADMRGLQVVDILAHDKILILDTKGNITEYDASFKTHTYHEQYNNDYKLNTDIYKSIKKSSIDPNVFYVLASNSISRKYFSKPANIIGKYVDVNKAFEAFALAPSVNSNYDQIIIREYYTKALYRLLDKVSFIEVVDTEIHDQIFELNELKIDDEFVSAFVYNKIIGKLLYNHEILIENFRSIFECKYTKFGPEVIRVIYPNISAVQFIEQYMNNALIGLNEIVSSAVLNRIIERLYRVQITISNIISPSFSNVFPLNDAVMVIADNEVSLVDLNPPIVKQLPGDTDSGESGTAPTNPAPAPAPSTAYSDFELLWQYDTGAKTYKSQSPAIGLGKCVFGDTNGVLHCFDMTYGTRLWSRNPGEELGQWVSCLIDTENEIVYAIYDSVKGSYMYNIDINNGDDPVYDANGSNFPFSSTKLYSMALEGITSVSVMSMPSQSWSISPSVLATGREANTLWYFGWNENHYIPALNGNRWHYERSSRTQIPSRQSTDPLPIMSNPAVDQVGDTITSNVVWESELLYPGSDIYQPKDSALRSEMPKNARYLSIGPDGKRWMMGEDAKFAVFGSQLPDNTGAWGSGEPTINVHKFPDYWTDWYALNANGQTTFDGQNAWVVTDQFIHIFNSNSLTNYAPDALRFLTLSSLCKPNPPCFAQNNKAYFTTCTNFICGISYDPDNPTVVWEIDERHFDENNENYVTSPVMEPGERRLVVVTDTGKIQCFATDEKPLDNPAIWSQHGGNAAKTNRITRS